jgi:WD40 repeat protein
MSVALDRRALLSAAGHLALGAVAVGASSAPRPQPKAEDGLKLAAGEGLLPIPSGATGRLGDPRLRVQGYLNALQYSPRGTALVAASGDELRAWNPRTGKVLFRLDYPEGASVDAGRLTSRDTFALLVRPHSGNKLEFRHYAFGTGKHIAHTPPLDLDHAQQTAFSTDGTLAAIVRQQGFCLFDTVTGKEKWREVLPPEAVGGCRFFPDASSVALAAKGAVKVFDTATGKLTAELKVGPLAADAAQRPPGARGRDWVDDVAVSVDGRWLAAGVGEDGDEVHVWEVKTRTVRHRLKPAAKPLGFTPDGSQLATFKEGTVTFWTTASGANVRTFDVPADSNLVLSPDGKVLASAAGDGAVLIDTATGRHLPFSADPPGTPERLRFDRTGRLVGLLTGWGGWIEWNLATRKARLIRPGGVGGHTPVALSLDGHVGLYRRKNKYEARQIETGAVLISAKGPDAPDTEIPVAALTTDGQTLVLPADEGVALHRRMERHVIKRQGELAGVVAGLSVAANGRLAVLSFRANSDKHFIELYDLPARRFARRIAIDGDVRSVELMPEGPWLAVSHGIDRGGRFSDEGSAAVFDWRTGRKVLQVPADPNQLHMIALSPDGRVLARWEHTRADGPKKAEHRIVIWEIQAGKTRARFDAGGSVSSMAFSPDGRTLAASVNGAPVFLWDQYAADKNHSTWDNARLEQAWNELGADDATIAFRAVKRLAQNSSGAIPMLRDKLPPVEPPDSKLVSRWIADLDHKHYRRREAATRALGALGERVRGTLQQALASGPSPEVRERIERLLAADIRPTLPQLRGFRAVEALEAAGTPEAVKLLAEWSGGAPGAGLTDEAGGALKRLAARRSN